MTRTRPTFRNNTFYFSGGHSRTYHRPVIRYRYRDYYRRPAIIVENYDPVPGYIWVAGQWSWNGYEWNWINGHYEVDANYVDDDYYYSPTSYVPAAEADCNHDNQPPVYAPASVQGPTRRFEFTPNGTSYSHQTISTGGTTLEMGHSMNW